MTDTDRLPLVAIAVGRGTTVEEAWQIVDALDPSLDARAASLAVQVAAADLVHPY